MGRCAWGQPFALAATALASVLLAERALLPVYVALVVGALARASCAWGGAALLAAVFLVHGHAWAARATDIMAWGVSGALLLAALGIGLQPRTSRRSPISG
jgi:hypothetical protein